MRRVGRLSTGESGAQSAVVELSPPAAAGCASPTKRRGLLHILRTVSVVLFVGLALAATSCGPGYPPNIEIIDPPLVVDGEGCVVTAYQVNWGDGYMNSGDGPITYIQRLTPDGERLWGERGISLDERQPEKQSERNPMRSYTRLVANTDGGATAFWTYENEILAKKVDGDGSPVWKDETIVGTCRDYRTWTALENPVGATIVWIDPDGDLHVKTLDADGSPLWPEQPLVADVLGFEAACDPSGRTWVLWVDASTRAVRLHVVDNSGGLVWADAKELQGGLPESAWPTDSNWYGLYVGAAPAEDVVVAWVDRHNPTPLKVLRLDVAGNVLSSTTTDRVGRRSWTRLSEAVVGDGTGGLFAFWAVDHSFIGQHIDAQGRIPWGEIGLEVATLPEACWLGGVSCNVGSDLAGGAVVSWGAYAGPGETVFRVARIDSAGNILWSCGGAEVGPANWSNNWVVTAAKSGLFLTRGVSASNKSHVQKVDLDGHALWGESGVRLDEWRGSGSNEGE